MRCDITFGGVFSDYPPAERPDTVGKLGAGRGGDLLIVTVMRPLRSQTVPVVLGAGRHLPGDHRRANGYKLHRDRKWVAARRALWLQRAN